MKKRLFALGFLAFALGNCTTPSDSESRTDSSSVAEAGPIIDDAHTSQNSLDYAGTYTGVLPCADCPGIETEIVLGTDNSYIRKMTYLEKKEGNVFEEKGTYTWDAAGQTITLEGLDAPNQYFVGENTLTQLDIAGKKVEGELANFYILKK